MNYDKENIVHPVSDSILIDRVLVSGYKIPTETPEADGTIKWNSTELPGYLERKMDEASHITLIKI